MARILLRTQRKRLFAQDTAMNPSRRDFFRISGAAGLSGLAATQAASASTSRPVSPDWMGVLVDIPNCIGCRKCEFACREATARSAQEGSKEAALFQPPDLDTFEDKSVFASHRRPEPHCHTMINRYPNPADAANPIYVKANCLHCNDPACASACLVGAFRKQPDGAVTYDAWKCMGCRYCMVACPFQIPTYEYDNPLTPQVRKCTLCANEGNPNKGTVPACAKICPRECLIWGKRADLLELAHEKIRNQPDRYVDHVYGEHEAGGTSWLYLSGVPFEKLDLVKLDPKAPPRLTESVQHGVFKYFVPPLAWYGILGLIMHLSQPRSHDAHGAGPDPKDG